MLRKERRLAKRSAWERVYQQGRSWAHPLVVLYTLPVPPPELRFGVAVGRRIGGAVVRNRVKRRLRHILRDLEPRVRPGLYAVVTARASAATASYAALREVVERLLQRAGALRAGEADTAPYAWPAGGARRSNRATERRATADSRG